MTPLMAVWMALEFGGAFLGFGYWIWAVVDDGRRRRANPNYPWNDWPPGTPWEALCRSTDR